MHNSRLKNRVVVHVLCCFNCCLSTGCGSPLVFIVLIVFLFRSCADARLFELFKLLFLIVGVNQFLCLMARETDFMAAAS